MMRLCFARCCALLVTAAIFANCSRNNAQPLPKKITLEALTALPDETPTDWVSYVDQISIATVLSESVIEPPSEVRKHGEGYVGRTVRLRIDETLWSNDGVVPQVGEIDLVTLGWVLKGNKYIVSGYPGAPRVEVGGRYILPLVRDGKGWATLTPNAVAAAGNDSIAAADVRNNGNNKLAQEISSLDATQVLRMLAAAPRAPLVEKYRHLPPLQRAEAVRLELAGPLRDFGPRPATAVRRGPR